MTITSIALEKLAVSPDNVRKTHSKSGFDDLKASILAHGLLNNLVVTPAAKGMYYVVAGARRLSALQALQKEGKLPKGHAVPCQVKDDGDASEASLAENVVREAMHPADEFEAFAALSKDHKPAEIANRFGTTEKHVLQRLKLGKVAPEILTAYREEKLNLEALMAYTLTDDHNAQRKAFKAQGGYHNAHVIKRLLTENKADADSKLARFVGLAAYQKAGGKITSDLFGKDRFLDDATLLQKLATEKLTAAAEKLKAEGWGWLEVKAERDYGFTSKCGQIEAKPIGAPKKLIDKHTALQAQYAKLETELDADEDGDNDEAYDRLHKLQEQIESIEQELEEFNAFTPAEMKAAGCYVTVGHDGKLHVEKGLVKPGDKKAVKSEGATAETEPKEKGFSQSLIDSLKQQRLQIAQAAIAANPDVALDLIAFKAACDRFTSSMYFRSGPEVSFSRNNFRANLVQDAKNTAAGKQMLSIHEKLNLTWMKERTEEAKFASFQALPDQEKLAILAYCVAATLQPRLAEKGAFETALGCTETDVAAYWRPTAENYLSRLTREQLLDIGREVFGKAWADKWATAKKGAIVKELDRAFGEPAKYCGDKAAEQKLRTWLPEGMAFTPEGKAKTKKKAA